MYLNLTFLTLTVGDNGFDTDNTGAILVMSSHISVDGSTAFRNNSVGKNGGAIFGSSSQININGSGSFSYNSATGNDGGAIYVDSSVVGIDGNALFTYNKADNNGGALCADSSIVSFQGNVEFCGNYADQGGGLGGAIKLISSEIGIDGRAVFTNNSAGNGGAIEAFLSEIGIDGEAMFTNNYATIGGGISMNASEIGIDGSSLFTLNMATYGGGISALLSELDINGSAVFTQNWAYLGGAICSFDSDIGITGIAIYTHNWGYYGGALYGSHTNISFTRSKIHAAYLSRYEGELYSEAGGDYTSNWSTAFIENSAEALGGAIYIQVLGTTQVSDAIFKDNAASVGGAVYVLGEQAQETLFSACVFEGNNATDGGAVYLYTGPGLNIFTESVFSRNYARIQGGAIFHTGTLHIFNSSFVANEVGLEGAAMMSLGFLEELSNVSFLGNTYNCGVGKYGYIIKDESNQTGFCSSCLDEICSRCSTGRNGIDESEGVRIDGRPVCAEPPLGAKAPSSGTTLATLALEKGFFRTSNQSHVILKCYQENACRGGSDADVYCASGYTGPYCAVCADGFAPGVSYSCRECSGGITRSAVGLTLAFGVAVFLLAALWVSHLGSVVHNQAEEDTATVQNRRKQKCWSRRTSFVAMLPLTAIKIVVTVWQIVSQFDAIAGDVYPELYKTFISKLNPVNLDLDFVFSYSCLVRNDFYDRLLFSTITPFVVLVVLGGSYFMGKKMNSGSASALHQVRHKHQAAALYVAFFVYSPVSYRIFQTFGCDELDNGETFLRADYSISCLTSRHSWYEAYALIMVGVYPVGITCAFAWLVLWHRRDLVKSERQAVVHLVPFHGLWAAYKPSRYFYEVVECGRRIALTAIAAFVLPNSKAQISISLLFSLVFVFISETLSPFHKGVDMGLYRWGNGIIVASMYVAFLMKVDVGQNTTQYMLTFSAVLIGANIFMVVTVLLQTALLVYELRRVKRLVKMVDVPIRRTHSHSARGFDSLCEWGEGGGDDMGIEAKHWEI